MSVRSVVIAGAAVLLFSCRRTPNPSPPAASSVVPAAAVSAAGAKSQKQLNEKAPKLLEPTTLVEMPISAYPTSLALDDDVVYLLTSNAAYKLTEGQPVQGIELDLGIGPVVTESAIIFWSKGSIWGAPKHGGEVRALAKLPHQPQYFVAEKGHLAWVDHSDAGPYTIQSLDGRKPRVLVTASGELSALTMIADSVFFVQRAEDNSWRVGRARVQGGDVEYSTSRTGQTPAMLTGTESLVYYDMKTSEIRRLQTDLQHEETWLKDFVCTPLYESINVYCACVEGLFEVRATDHKPHVLIYGRHETITYIRANSKYIVWTVDKGPDKLAVYRLPVVATRD